MERLVFYGAGAMGFIGEADLLENITKHLQHDHMVGMGNSRRSELLLAHYAAHGRGEITLERGKLVIKKS